jgi:uncharacterized protein GlcG (DUF336 family)
MNLRTRSLLFAFSICCPLTAAADEALTTFKVLKPQVALQLAQATMEACRKEGYQVAVAVVDRFGVTQVLLRDQLAGAHTPETATRKAWTAASFKTDTQAMMEETQAGKPQSGARFVPGALMFSGGLPVNAAGSLVGGIGVSGAPGGELDRMCAEKGIEAIEDALMF